MNRKDIKLYNMIFPLWLLWLVPRTWIVVLPANFFVDLLVIVLSLKFLKVKNIKHHVKGVIISVWLFGFLADFIGTAAMIIPNILDLIIKAPQVSAIVNQVNFNAFYSIYSFLWVTFAVALTAYFIYRFNGKFCLKNSSLNQSQKKKLALSLSVFTAPYMFYVPTEWFV